MSQYSPFGYKQSATSSPPVPGAASIDVHSSRTPIHGDHRAAHWSSEEQEELPAPEVILSAIKLFFRYCNHQPLPLFLANTHPADLLTREPELLLAILVLASRFESVGTPRDTVATRKDYAASCRARIVQRLLFGPVEVSTIQTLCILSLAEFNGKLEGEKYVIANEYRRELCASGHV
jgi:hypothetical protein